MFADAHVYCVFVTPQVQGLLSKRMHLTCTLLTMCPLHVSFGGSAGDMIK